MDANALTAAIRRAEKQHPDYIEAVEVHANAMGGDLTIGEIVALLIRLGWQPPASK